MIKNKSTRTQKAFYNTISGLVQELVSVICGLILPRLILSSFGSAYNGITNSITQFISCVVLLKSGIGSVTRAALYKPLTCNDTFAISETINATQKYFKKISIIFLIFVLVFAGVYPFFVLNEFDWFFSFSLVLILSISTVAQYFFGYSYQMVLEADQKTYIVSIVSILSIVLNTVIAAILIKLNCSIHVVKLGSAFVFALPPFFYFFYVRKKYSIDSKVKPNLGMINQRWDAFAHQVSNFVNDNTDIMVITIFLGVLEVSVYSVYNMIAVALRKVIASFTNGMSAAFGNLYANNETSKMEIRFRQYELLVFIISLIISIVSSLMYLSFIKLYTSGITDVDYIRPFFAILISVCIFTSCMKLPYQQIIYAVGHFKETRNSTIVEAAINIITSVIAVIFMGVEGVIVGTIIASCYRAVTYSVYIRKNILTSGKNDLFNKLLIAFILFGCFIVLDIFVLNFDVSNYYIWILVACIYTLIVTLVVSLTCYIFYKNDFSDLLSTFINLFKKRRRIK